MLNTAWKYEIYRQTLILMMFTVIAAPIGLALSWLPWAAGGIPPLHYLLAGVGAVMVDLIKFKPWIHPRKEWIEAQNRR